MDSPASGGGTSSPATTPSVHVILVTHDSGLLFDETLESVAAQDTLNVRVTVVDAGSEADPSERVQRFLPEAHVLRLDANPGFAAAVNSVDLHEDDATYLAICHDDVVLAPNALRVLLETAVRSNAGIVGPKLVDWEQPERILQVGLGVDKAGDLAPRVEAGEFDQGQHDATADCFAVSGSCIVIRSDLFAALDGFDSGMSFYYEDVDFCWRAQLLGARVVVVPEAVVRHSEALTRRQKMLAERLQLRHRLRTLFSVYGVVHSLRVVPQVLFVLFVQFLAALVRGRLQQAFGIVTALSHNLFSVPGIWRRRRALHRSRRVDDATIRKLQVDGFAAVSSGLTARARSSLAAMLQARTLGLVWFLALAVLAFGSRHLITRGVPAVGEFLPLGSAHDLFTDWWSGFRPAGLGGSGFAPTGVAIVNVAGWLSLWQTGLTHTILICGLLPLGGLGIWRLVRPFDSTGVSTAALVAYLANPLPYSALAHGSWTALVAYAAAPWMLRSLALAGRLSPFGPEGGPVWQSLKRPRLFTEILRFGVLLALAAAFAPEVSLVLAMLLAGMWLGSVLGGAVDGHGRMLMLAVLASVVAVVLNIPWSLDLANDFHLSSLLGDRPSTPGGHSWMELLRFDTGAFGEERLGWALPAAAMLSLALAHDARLAWAVRGWTLYIGGAAVAWTVEQGWWPVSMPRPEVLLVPGAVGLSVAVAMGAAAFVTDVRRFRFGWRQMVPFTALLALVVSTFPILNASLDGRWDVPSDDFSSDVVYKDPDIVGGYRVLWLGHADVIPLRGWELDDDLSYAISDESFPTFTRRWAPPPDDTLEQAAAAVQQARDGFTTRLGTALAPLGIRYIVVVEQLAPLLRDEPLWPAPPDLQAGLAGQLDLEPATLSSSLIVYRNTAALAVRTVSTDSATAGALVTVDPAGSYAGPVPPAGQLLLASPADESWQLNVDGRTAPRRVAGWANVFDFTAGDSGDATLRYQTDVATRLLLGGQVLLWIAALLLCRHRRYSRRRGDWHPSQETPR